eukprot:1159094-Pelagomonas_calceolata.AAC.9
MRHYSPPRSNWPQTLGCEGRSRLPFCRQFVSSTIWENTHFFGLAPIGIQPGNPQVTLSTLHACTECSTIASLPLLH